MCVCYLHDIESALCMYDNYITFSQDNVALRVQVQFSAQAVTHSTSSTLVWFFIVLRAQVEFSVRCRDRHAQSHRLWRGAGVPA